MPVCRLLVLCFGLLLLTGCGTVYQVRVDSLRDPAAPATSGSVCLQPGKGAESDQLLFREVTRMLAPAFTAKNMRLVDSCDEAGTVAVVSYGEGEPSVHFSTVTDYKYVSVRPRGSFHRQWVQLEQQRLTATTYYAAHMLVEAFARSNAHELGTPLWRTRVRASSSAEGYRALLSAIAYALRETLATGMDEEHAYEVTVKDDGTMSIEATGN